MKIKRKCTKKYEYGFKIITVTNFEIYILNCEDFTRSETLTLVIKLTPNRSKGPYLHLFQHYFCDFTINIDEVQTFGNRNGYKVG